MEWCNGSMFIILNNYDRPQKGEAVFVKMDIFKNFLWYTYKEESSKWFRLTLEHVLEIIELNKNNEKSASLEEYESEVEIPVKVSFEDAVGEDSLTRFDAPIKSNRRKKSKKKFTEVAENSIVENPQKQGNQQRKPQQQIQKQPQKPTSVNNQENVNQPNAAIQSTNKKRYNNRNRKNRKPKNDSNSQ
mgnify:CR=1 FL=1